MQERERLVASAEAITRQRMRQTEALQKEAEANALLDGNGVRLQALLGRGQGNFPGRSCRATGSGTVKAHAVCGWSTPQISRVAPAV